MNQPNQLIQRAQAQTHANRYAFLRRVASGNIVKTVLAKPTK